MRLPKPHLRVPTWLIRLWESPLVQFVWGFLERFGRHQVTIYAAALSYYMLLSIIPLLLSALFITSFFLDTQSTRDFIVRTLGQYLPFQSTFLQDSILNVLKYRGSLGPISALTTLWSASGMFSSLEKAINSLWDQTQSRPYLEQRALGILTVLIMTVWILMTLWIRTLVQVLPYVFPFLQDLPPITSAWTERGISALPIVLFNITVYLFFPHARRRKRIAISLGLLMGLLWSATRELFAWAMAVGLLNYPLVYGSLWSIIVPIIWAYWSFLLLLTGAELQAYIEERHQRHQNIIIRGTQ